jgi:cysteinyl-tRNA synthetase
MLRVDGEKMSKSLGNFLTVRDILARGAWAGEAFRVLLLRTHYRSDLDFSFATLDEARAWAAGFVRWYNVEHHHSGIRYVSPAQRHAGDDQAVLAARHALYIQARQRNPRRWSGNTRDWSHIGVVSLNPERDSVVNTAANAPLTRQKAA